MTVFCIFIIYIPPINKLDIDCKNHVRVPFTGITAPGPLLPCTRHCDIRDNDSAPVIIGNYF